MPTESEKPKFKPRLTKPDGSNSYYWGRNNPWGYSPLSVENCTTYAWCRFHEIMGTLKDPSGYHLSTYNAEDWYNNTTGYAKGKTPKLGAILCLRDGNFSGWGHVAIVEEIKENGDIVTSEGGYNDYTFEIKNRPKSQNYVPYGGYGFQGFIYPPIDFEGTGFPVDGETEEGTGIDFQKRASKLISSDNYAFIGVEEEEQVQAPSSMVTTLKESLNNININLSNILTSVTNVVSDLIASALNQTITASPKLIKQKSTLALTENVVEAPFIEVTIGEYTIGSYQGSLDTYPNFISSLQVSKQNGIINQYVINLTHQIRPGDDSNLLDELLSTVNYDKIIISYGDANSGVHFRDENAIITNVKMNRSYTSMNISYTLEATSEGQLIKTFVTNFPAVTDKPSNVLNKLIYGTGEVSTIIQEAFPGMQNATFVSSNNLLPHNDAVVDLDAQRNANVLDYINYLVANMSNQASGNDMVRNSTYYITYVDNDPNNPDGAYMQIKELNADIAPHSFSNKIYDVTIGYPKDIVYSFTVDNTQSWELLYKHIGQATEYYYTISNNGDVEKYYSPSIVTSSNVVNEINKNWWTQMVKFPITAQLTVKGLVKPVMLMDYINIDVVFYGQHHITSGIYAITGQTDFLSGSGYRTTLSLVRVGDSYE